MNSIDANEQDDHRIARAITIQRKGGPGDRLVVSITDYSLSMFQHLGSFIAIGPDAARPVWTDSAGSVGPAGRMGLIVETGAEYKMTRDALCAIVRRAWNDELDLDGVRREIWPVLRRAFPETRNSESDH